MKYRVIAGPIQMDATTQAHDGEIIELPEADGIQLARWGIVEPVVEEPAPAPEHAPATTKTATTTTTAKAATTEPDTTTTK